MSDPRTEPVATFGMPAASPTGSPLDGLDLDAVIGDAPSADDLADDLTPAEALEREFASEVSIPTKAWDIDGRAGWAAEFRTDVDDSVLDKLRDRCRIKGGKKGVDGKAAVDGGRLSLLTLITYNTGLYYNGQLYTDDHGTPVTYRSSTFLDLASRMVPKWREAHESALAGQKAPDPRRAILAGDCVLAWYGVPGAAAAAAGALMEASAYLDDPSTADLSPTSAD